jgi:hypothetical protein
MNKYCADSISIPQEELEKLLSLPYSKETRLLAPMGYCHVKFASEALKSIKVEIDVDLQGRKDLRKNIDKAFRLIMANFVVCVFERKPLSLSGSDKDYLSGTYYRNMFLTFNAVDRLVKALIKHEFIKKRPGSKALKQVNSYLPLKKLEELLVPLLYEVQEEYTSDTELVIFTNKNNKTLDMSSQKYLKNSEGSGTKDTMLRTSYFPDLPDDHPDIVALRRINEALQKCTYPLKSPVRRIYSDLDPFKGGRLYTKLQTLPDKRARIRINTLFNGEPVAEVDLSANHPRMLMALKKEELSPTFYEDVATATNTTREQAKFFLMKAIGAVSRRISLMPKGDEKLTFTSNSVLSNQERLRIEQHLEEHYPVIHESLYKGLGVVLQGFEGQILIQAILTLLDQGIPSLPIHDALYVQKKYADLAVVALSKSWKLCLKVEFKPIIKIDVIDENCII